MEIAGRKIGQDHPCFIVAEMAGNAGQDYRKAIQMVIKAEEAGADAVKLQVYDPDRMPDKNDIIRGFGPPWDGKTGWEIYKHIAMPWEWVPGLKGLADALGIILFTTVCQQSAAQWVENNSDIPAYKIAEWQARDWRLIQFVNKANKPIIVSVKNMSQPLWATKYASDVAFLAKDDLVLMRRLQAKFKVPIGYSNHGPVSRCVKAVEKGACIVEQHFTLSRDTIDGTFAAQPDQLKEMVQAIREVEK